MSEATKQKIREAMLRIGHLPPSQKGRRRSEETIKKMSLSKMGHTHTDEVRALMSKKRTGEGNMFFGKIHSDLSRKKMSESRKRLLASGFIIPNKKYFDPETAQRNRRWVKNKNGRIKGFLRKKGSYHTFLEWEKLKETYGNTCPCCKKKEPEIKLSQDHIVPLSKGGGNEIANIQPLCLPCNLKKNTKTTRYNL